MPKYQKNKRRRRHRFSKIKTTQTVNMVPSEEETEEKQKKPRKLTSFRILNGKKQAKKIRRFIALGFILTLAVVIVLISLLSPTGIGEMYKNFSATFSFESQLPVELHGTESYAVSIKNNYFYLLSDTNISVISNNGKISLSDNHGFSSPVLCESEARCLIYDQNGQNVRIYNAEELLLSKETENIIYAADIARDGTFAIAGKSEKFTSMVSVFSSDGELKYEWYCPEETINAVAVAPDGNSVAVSTVSVSAGEFASAVYVLKFDSADPVFERKYDSEYIYGFNSVSRKYFTVICENKCDIISWKNLSVTTYETQYSIFNVKANNKCSVIASCRENNDGNYSFIVYNRKNKPVLNFDFQEQVDDFQIKGKNIFILSGNNVYLINGDGEIAKKGVCGFGIVKIIPVSSGSCLAVGHNSITKINLQ